MFVHLMLLALRKSLNGALTQAEKAGDKEKAQDLQDHIKRLEKTGSKALHDLSQAIKENLPKAMTLEEDAAEYALCSQIGKVLKTLSSLRTSLNPDEEVASKPSAAMMTAQAVWEHLPGAGAAGSTESRERNLPSRKEKKEEELETEMKKKVGKGKMGEPGVKKVGEKDEEKDHPGFQQLQEGGKEAERKVATVLKEAGYVRGPFDGRGDQHVLVTAPQLQIIFPTQGERAEVDWKGHGPVQKLEWRESWEIAGESGRLAVHPLHFSPDNVYPNPLCTRFPLLSETSATTEYIIEEGVTINDSLPLEKVSQIDYKIAASLYEKCNTINPLALLEADLVAYIVIFPLTGDLWTRIMSKLQKLGGAHPYIRILSFLNRAFLLRPDNDSFAQIRQRCLVGGAVHKIAGDTYSQSARLSSLETLVQKMKIDQEELLRRSAPEPHKHLDQAVAEWLDANAKPLLTPEQLKKVKLAFAKEELEEKHIPYLTEKRVKQMGLPYGIVLDLLPILSDA